MKPRAFLARPHGPPAPGERLAAIDVGSNSIRLLVAEYDEQGGIKVIDEVKDQPRLASGIAESGRLEEFAMARAIQALSRMREVAERRGVRRLAAVATSAVREAANGREFIERVRREVGIPLRVIDPETEANLSWRSVAHHFPITTDRVLVADIGGGSLELIGAVNGMVELTRSSRSGRCDSPSSTCSRAGPGRKRWPGSGPRCASSSRRRGRGGSGAAAR
jgi:exopolyphosphatase/guanosine-5'-triphosphate,3'-diphosphate pyrophosphatase